MWAILRTNGGAPLRATGQPTNVQAVLNRSAAPARFSAEEAVYAAAGLPYIPPELREGHGEIELAESGKTTVSSGGFTGTRPFFTPHTLTVTGQPP